MKLLVNRKGNKHRMPLLSKTLLIMKLTTCLILILTLNATAKTTAQNVTLKGKNISLEKIFETVKDQTGYAFVYDASLLKKGSPVTLSVKNEPLNQVLDYCFKDQPFTYEIKYKVIVIKEKAIVNKQVNIYQVPPNNISGKITDTTGKPLSGATIKVKGTNQATQSDANGDFLLTVQDATTLVVSYVGYETIEVQVDANSKPLKIALKQKANAVDEVVVVGYQSVKKENYTGAVSTVTSKEINQRTATNTASLLQGKLPGLQTIQGSGEPGNENVQFQVRGLGTFSGAGVSPLVIVDGLPGNINTINQSDIESVTVLKDAASAAIYGSRGANGVIVVTTKKGVAGKLSINYGYSYGIVNSVKLPDVITNSVDYMNLLNQALINSNQTPLFADSTIAAYKNATDRTEYPNFDWLGAMFKTAYVKTHTLNVSGGNEKTTYNFSLAATDQPGTMLAFSYKKYALGISLTSKVSDRITFGTDLQIRYDKKSNPPQGADDQFLSTLAQSPLYAPEKDGKYIARAYTNAEPGNKNSIAIANTTITNYTNYYGQGNIRLNIKLIDGLTWENKGGFTYYSGDKNDFRPTIPLYFYHSLEFANNLDVGGPGLRVTDESEVYGSAYSQLNFNKKYGAHQISALAGYQQDYDNYRNLGGVRNGYPTNLLSQLNAGGADGQSNSGYATEWSLKAFYSNISYTYDDKYSIAASYRRDGSSRFADGHRYGDYYSVSGSWLVSKENFFKNVAFIDNLKLRGSWGILGNQNIINPYISSTYSRSEPYPYQSLLDNTNYVFGSNYTTGLAVTQLVDQNITWEQTRIFDLGLDLTALRQRLSFSFDWSSKLTTNILRSQQVPLWVGLGAPTINNGTLKSTGWEGNIGWRDKIGKDWGYSISANAQAYTNELVNYGTTDIDGSGGAGTIRQTGHPLDQWYLYIWDGIFQSQDEIDKSPTQDNNPKPGTLKIKDVNGDGKITAADRTYVGGRYPKIQYSFNVGFNWKDLDFSAQFYSFAGQKILVNGWGIEPFVQGSVPPVEWLTQSWTPQNHSNTMPLVYSGSYAPISAWGSSTYFLKDASFFRLRGMQVGYNLHLAALQKAIGLNQIRLYVQGDNLFTISKYPGLDPERTGSGGRYVTYPQIRTITFGANVQF